MGKIGAIMRIARLLKTVPLLVWVLFVSQVSYSQGMKPKIRLEFEVTASDLSQLSELLMRFARDEGFSISDHGAKMPPKNGRPLFWMELSRGSLVEVDVNNIRSENRVFVWIYELSPNPEFDEVAGRLEKVLREKWPNIAPYKGL